MKIGIVKAVVAVSPFIATLAAPVVVRADLLTAGARSGSASVSVLGFANSPFHTDTQTGSIPATGPGNLLISTAVGSFGGTASNPQGNPVRGTASVDLNTVGGNTYDLDAGARFSYTYIGSSGMNSLDVSYTFSQEIVVTQPVSFSLALTFTPTVRSWWYTGDFESHTSKHLTWPTLTFSGPGVNDSVTGETIPETGTANPVTNTYAGILQPGTYTFSSTWDSTTLYFWNTDGSVPEQYTGTGAHLSVAAIPEPSFLAVAALAAPLAFARQGNRRPRAAM